jgi:hypothetical protein
VINWREGMCGCCTTCNYTLGSLSVSVSNELRQLCTDICEFSCEWLHLQEGTCTFIRNWSSSWVKKSYMPFEWATWQQECLSHRLHLQTTKHPLDTFYVAWQEGTSIYRNLAQKEREGIVTW